MIWMAVCFFSVPEAGSPEDKENAAQNASEANVEDKSAKTAAEGSLWPSFWSVWSTSLEK